MWSFLKKIILFPLDLLYVTFDAWRVFWLWIKHRIFRREKDFPCLLCRGEDTSEVPHPVRSVYRYQNRWLVKLLSPCLTSHREGKRRLPVCMREGGYTTMPGYVPVLALVLTYLWVGGSLGLLKASSSEPEHFWSNFITFFSPQRTLGQNDKGPDFLEAGEARLNPERAEKYFQSGIKHLDQQKFPQAQVDFKIALQSDPLNSAIHFNLAKSLLALGQVVQAESSLRKTIELSADHVQARLLLAELLERRESRAEALVHTRHALKVQPANIEALRLNIILESAEGNAEMATVLADTLLRLDPEGPDSLALLGKFQFNNLQNPAEARVLLDKALAIDPKHIPSLLAMVPLHVQAQELAKVDETLGRVLAIEPENLNALRLDAEMLSARYGLAAGLRAYNRLLNKFGGDLGLRLRYAELLLQSGRISEGKSLADQLTSSRVPAIERSAHWMLAQVYAKARLFEEAVTHARRTLVLAPDTRNVQLFLGKCLMELGKHGEARIVLEAAFAKAPQDASVVDLLSQVLISLGESDKALALIAKTLQEQPEMDALRMRLVEIRMRGDNWQESLVDARTLHEKFPDNPALANNYAFQLARSGANLDEALGLMQPLYEKYRDNPVIMDTYATVLAAQKRHAEAIAIYQEALVRAPGNTSIRFHLAKSLAAVGDVAQARQELESVLKIEPGFPQAKEVRDMLQGLPIPPRSGT